MKTTAIVSMEVSIEWAKYDIVVKAANTRHLAGHCLLRHASSEAAAQS
jgi:hypothetical protein